MAQESKADHNTSTLNQAGLLSKILSQYNRQFIGMGEAMYNQFLADARVEASKPDFDALKFLRNHDSTRNMKEFKEPKLAVHNISHTRLAQPLQQGRSAGNTNP